MKIISELVRVAVLFVVVSYVTTNIQNFCSSVSRVQHVTFETDLLFSPQTVEEILSYTHLLRFNSSYNPAALVKHLPERFSCIKSIDIQPLPYNAAKLIISAKEPLVAINNKHILTKSGTLLSCGNYDEKTRESLTSIAMAEAEMHNITPVMLQALSYCIDSKLTKSYNIEWLHEHELRLYDKNNKYVAIVCDSASLPNEKQLSQCTELIKEKITQKPNAQWKADVRFDDQIIISMDKGGQHGTFA